MKFYKHNVKESLERRDRNRKTAYADETETNNQHMAKFAIAELEEVAQIGLPDCYEGFSDFLYDWWPDLAWDKENQTKQIKIILATKGFPETARQIQVEWKYNMIENLQIGLKENENEK